MARRSAPPIEARRAYHHGDLRNALVQAALDLVKRRGVEAFSLREAARAVGVSPAAAYRHFEDKGALLLACALDGFARMSSAMQEALAREPGAPGTPARATGELVALGWAYVDFAVANPAHFRVMFGPWCAGPGRQDIPPGVLPADLGPYELLIQTLDAMVASGAIGAAARQGAEIAAWAAVHGFASLLVEDSLRCTPVERDAALATVLRTVALGLGASPALLGKVAERAPWTAPPAGKVAKGSTRRAGPTGTRT